MSPSPSEQIRNVFSVDVEDYFQVGAFENAIDRDDWDRLPSRVEDNNRRLVQLLDEHDAKGTFFVLGWIAERYPELVREIHQAGHELGVHGYDHRRVTTQTPAEFREDVHKSKAIIEELICEPVIGYRAPNYSIVERTLWAIDVLVEEGFRYDSSIFPIKHDHYGIADSPRFPWQIREGDRGQLIEFPISTLRLIRTNLPFVGGGYLRHFPFWFSRWGLRHLNRVERQPAIVYIHPWEIDPDQPRVEVGLATRIRHYRNLAQTESRLEGLLTEFTFTTAREVLGL